MSCWHAPNIFRNVKHYLVSLQGIVKANWERESWVIEAQSLHMIFFFFRRPMSKQHVHSNTHIKVRYFRIGNCRENDVKNQQVAHIIIEKIMLESIQELHTS